MNILITLYSTSWGGAEESIISLAEEISKNDHKVILLWVSNYSLPKPITTQTGVKIVYLHLIPEIYKIFSGLIVISLCLSNQIKIVNLNWRFVKEEGYFLKFARIKSVATLRAILFDRTNSDEYKNTDAIIGVSKAVVRQIKKLGYRKPCYTIYNGISIEKLKLFDTKLYSPQKILSMSRLVAWKRVDWSVKAVHFLNKKGLPITLDIYGDGPEKMNLSRLILDLGAEKYIRLCGHINNNSHLLKDYGIFLSPSFKEPFGKTIVENVLRGRVIVASRSGGIPELLPKYDLLFKCNSLDDYIQKIQKAYEKHHLYTCDIQKRSESFQQKYNMQRVAKDYINIYQKL